MIVRFQGELGERLRCGVHGWLSLGWVVGSHSQGLGLYLNGAGSTLFASAWMTNRQKYWGRWSILLALHLRFVGLGHGGLGDDQSVTGGLQRRHPLESAWQSCPHCYASPDHQAAHLHVTLYVMGKFIVAICHGWILSGFYKRCFRRYSSLLDRVGLAESRVERICLNKIAGFEGTEN